MSKPRTRILYLAFLAVLSACSHTVIETYYAYRLPSMVDFDVAGNITGCGFPETELVYQASKKVSVRIGHSRVGDDGNYVDIIYQRLHDKGVNGVLLSNRFTFFHENEEVSVSELSVLNPSSITATFRVPVSSQVYRFRLQVPDFEVDGIHHAVPMIEFEKVTGPRRVSTILCH